MSVNSTVRKAELEVDASPRYSRAPMNREIASTIGLQLSPKTLTVASSTSMRRESESREAIPLVISSG